MPSCLCRHQVRKILDLVQSKGEEVSEFLLHVLQQLADAYVDLGPWLAEIGFSPSGLIQSKTVVNTDPGMSHPRGKADTRPTRPWVWKCYSGWTQEVMQAGPPQAWVLGSFWNRRAGPCCPRVAQGTVTEGTTCSWSALCRGPWECGNDLCSDLLLAILTCVDILMVAQTQGCIFPF